jgi:hypothetical protein
MSCAKGQRSWGDSEPRLRECLASKCLMGRSPRATYAGSVPTTPRRLAAAAGFGLVTILVSVMLVLTIVQRHYLTAIGWSPVHRSPVEWPSLLATGPHGWLMSAAFTLAAALALVLAWAVLTGQRGWVRRCVGVGLLLAAVGLAAVAFPADAPGSATASWHATVHNSLYPLIPLGAIVATTAGSWPGAASADSPLPQRTARVLLAFLVVLFGLTNLDPVAQLARYGAFGTALSLVTIVSVRLLAEDRRVKTSTAG